MNEKIYEMGVTFGPVKDGSGRIIHNGTDRIGDRIIFSSLIQMLCEQRDYDRIVDLDADGRNWFFDKNPFIVRGAKAKSTIPLQIFADKSTFHSSLRNLPMFMSVADKFCSYFGLDCTIRHPRLYAYEDSERNPKKIIVTTQGRLQGHMMGESSDRMLSDEIIDQILRNYKNYDIYQVGTPNDKKVEGNSVTDLRGIPIWDVVKHISESSSYIGVNTGIMWISAAFPHINKKIVLCEYSEESLKYYIPSSTNHHHSQWNEIGFQYFNRFDRDIGVTFSYKKI